MARDSVARGRRCAPGRSYRLGLNDVLGWMVIALVLGVGPVLIVTAFTSRRRQRAGRADAPTSGGLLGFDELFHPAAHNARLQWESEQRLAVPAPTPDKGPGVIGEGGVVVIEVDR